jgi:hypothetical protein
LVPWQSVQAVIGTRVAALAWLITSKPTDKEMNRYDNDNLFIFPPSPVSE